MSNEWLRHVVEVTKGLCEEVRANELNKPAPGTERLAAHSQARYDAGIALITECQTGIACQLAVSHEKSKGAT
jgi:hypothetical protein